MTSKRKTTKAKPMRRRKPARRPVWPTSDKIEAALHEIARLSPLDEVLYGNRLEKALADVDRACEAIKAREFDR